MFEEIKIPAYTDLLVWCWLMVHTVISSYYKFCILWKRSLFCILERKEIGFHTRLAAEKVYNRQEIVKFATVDTNEGSRYDANTGKFTAPEEGMYFFTVMHACKSHTYTTWYIKSSKDDTIYAMALADAQGTAQSASASASAVIKLSRGDTVFVYHHDASNGSTDQSVRCDTHSCPTFSGYAIN